MVTVTAWQRFRYILRLEAIALGCHYEIRKSPVMKEDLKRSVGFFRATAPGGILFLLPLAVVVGLLGYVYSFVVVIYEPLKQWVPVHDAAGLTLLFGAAVLLLLFGCFAAGTTPSTR